MRDVQEDPHVRFSFWTMDTAIWTTFALLKLILHLGTANGYGYFRDELYFMDCGRRLDFGYVDHPPMIGWIVWLSGALMGESLFALRLFPAVSGSIKIFLAGWMARELGGGWYAQALACLAFLIMPSFLAADSMLSIVSFEQLFWMIGSCVLLRLIRTGDPREWVWFGLAAGLGLLTKHSLVFFVIATVGGMLLTPQRKFLMSPWFWAGGLITCGLALPNLIWQINHDWPTLSLLRQLNQSTHSRITLIEFLLGQALYHHPVAFPLGLIGLYHLFFTGKGKPYRLFGWIFVFGIGLFLVMKSKIYYTSPLYPVVIAAGAVRTEEWIQKTGWQWPCAALVFLFVGTGLILAPFVIPLLPMDIYQRYVGILTRPFPNVLEARQLFVDRFGWENQAATVAKIYHSLPPEERAQCMIGTANYGEAGAVNFFGQRYGLPRAVCGQLSYHLWGPGNASMDTAIVYGTGLLRERVNELWGEVEEAGLIQSENCAPWENNLPIFVCRKPKYTLQEIWPQLRDGF